MRPWIGVGNKWRYRNAHLARPPEPAVELPSHPWRDQLWVPFASIATFTALALAVRALGEWRSAPAWFTKLTDPHGGAALWIFAVAFGLSVALYAWTRRRLVRAISLVVSSAMALTALVLGMASYWPCAGNEPAVFAPFAWTLTLFAGGAEQPWSGSGQCPSGTPLALQLARVTALGATFTSLVGILFAVSRHHLDRLLARVSRSKVVVIAVDPTAGPMLKALGTHKERRTRLVVVDHQGDPGLAGEARAVGALLVEPGNSQVGMLEDLLIRHGTICANEIYILGASVVENMKWVRLVEKVMRGHKPSPALIPRVLVRIDNPWAAEAWRRDHVGMDSQWLTDALSAYEVTARFLVDELSKARAGRLVLVGRSLLSLAILGEMAQRRREERMLALSVTRSSTGEDAAPQQTGGPTPPVAAQVTGLDVTLVGEDARELLEEHRLSQRRLGNTVEITGLEVVGESATVGLIAAACEGKPRPVVIIASPPGRAEEGFASRLAVMRPSLQIYEWTANSPDVPGEPVMDQLFPFGLTLVGLDSNPPADNWTRIARLQHKEYCASRTTPPNRPSLLPWDEGLPTFYQTSNVRQLGQLLGGVRQLGRTWSATFGVASEQSFVQFRADEIEKLAIAEHESWRQFYLAHGWRQHTRRNDEKRRHDLLCAWEDLPYEPDDPREWTRASVRNGLALLASLGYRSTTGWKEYKRQGQVRAKRLTDAWQWHTIAGAVLRARAGDWRVTDDQGNTWSVEDSIFQSTYALVKSEVFERTGTVRARRALPGEVVISREGREVAVEGDWVLEGAEGEQWIVGNDHFAKAYGAADAGALPSR